MSFKNHSCSIIYEIIDSRSGDYICTNCGLVLDKVYEFNTPEKNYNKPDAFKDYVLEILEKLNLPKYIYSYVQLNMKNQTNKEKLIINELYRVLSKLEIPFSRKDLEAVSGVKSKQIYASAPKNEDNMVVIDVKLVLERYCKKLELTYEDYSLIKNSIPEKNYGFNPTTIASAYIYMYCRKNKKSIKLKDITEVTGVTCMSVHRFMRKNGISRSYLASN
jgi:transcription initiation factor TFIIIB Brf1 subunit/transcription initiation factor TFIIB